ncbi:hypothetical protein SAMN05443999_11094 [Roseovarius azorensis]|uniref:Uncharacterized protein n=1 Tax=Roseovarius azorensis TaxID=1287727 RepID=A0A1H7UIA0_9RHOB|nr:hypothetical protein SAMN05443999_11094 [Roseovarius azorensis]
MDFRTAVKTCLVEKYVAFEGPNRFDPDPMAGQA